MIYVVILLILTAIYTFYMGYTDGSNAVATTVATRALKPRTALLLSAIIHFVAVIIMYYTVPDLSVAATVGKGMINSEKYATLTQNRAFIFLLAGLISAIIWGIITFLTKIPNSTSHTLLGGIIGAGISAFGFDSILWSNVLLKIVLMIILAPIISVIIGFIINKLLKKLALRAPMGTSKAVTILQWVNVMFMSSSFAINNVQKSIGIYFLIVLLNIATLPLNPPIYIVIIFGLMLSLGMIFGGYRIIITVGHKLFKLKPLHSLSSQLSTNIVILVASIFGIPISTGQVISSSVVGIGISERASNVRWKTVGKVVIGWLVTIPITVVIGALIYLILNSIFGGIL